MKQWFFNMKRISQRDNHGCGIAAVATVCGVTYYRARHEFFPRRVRFRDDESLHVSEQQMIDVIKRLGFEATTGQQTSVDEFARPALLSLEWIVPEGFGVHTVVWDPWAKRVIDPGYDQDRGEPDSFFTSRWERSRFRPIIVTGKRHT